MYNLAGWLLIHVKLFTQSSHGNNVLQNQTSSFNFIFQLKINTYLVVGMNFRMLLLYNNNYWTRIIFVHSPVRFNDSSDIVRRLQKNLHVVCERFYVMSK